MATVAEMRAGLETRLATIAGLNESAYVKAKPVYPYAHVVPDEVEYDEAGSRGMDTWSFLVQVFVGYSLDRAIQTTLDKFLNPSGALSVKAAIEADKTLGGIVQDVHVARATGYRQYDRPDGRTVWGCDWTVVVLASGS